MRALILINLAAGILVTAAEIGFAASESTILMLVVCVGWYIAFPGLLVANLVGVFRLWQRQRWGSLLPIGSFALAVAVNVLGSDYGRELVLRGTVSRPATFLNTQTRQDLADIADRLLGHGIYIINTFPGERTQVLMETEQTKQEIPPEIVASLRRYGFIRTTIDDQRTTVQFRSWRFRKGYEYIYAKDGFKGLRDGMQPSVQNLGGNWYLQRW
jgi:hypothetical protein